MDSTSQSNGMGFEEKEVSLQDYLRILYRGKWIIIISFLVIMVATIYLTFTAVPQYEASTLIMLAGRAGQSSALFQNPFVSSNFMKVNNEIEVLKSQSLARRVVGGMQAKPYADSLYILGDREYEKKGVQLPDVAGALKKALKNLLLGKSEQGVAAVDTLYRGLVRNLQNAMTVEPIRDTEAIRLTVSSVDPDEAAMLANTIADQYYKMDLEFNRAEVVDVKDFVEEQLEKIEKDLVASEERLREFQETEGVVGLDETARTLIEQLSTFEATYYTTLAELKATQDRLAKQEETLNEREKWIVQETMNTTQPLVSELRNSIAEMEAEKIVAMRVQGLSAEHEGMADLNQRIEELRNRLVMEAQNISALGLSVEEQSKISVDLLNSVLTNRIEVMALQTRGNEYKKLVDKYTAVLNQLPERTLRYARLDRDRQVNEKYYMLMKTKLQESRITEASKISNVRIVDPAIPDQPNDLGRPTPG